MLALCLQYARRCSVMGRGVGRRKREKRNRKEERSKEEKKNKKEKKRRERLLYTLGLMRAYVRERVQCVRVCSASGAPLPHKKRTTFCVVCFFLSFYFVNPKKSSTFAAENKIG